MPSPAVNWYQDSNLYYYGYYDDYDYKPSIIGASQFALFASCWTLAFTLYLFLTSATDHTPSKKPIGKFFSQKIVYAVDLLSALFWFAGFIALAQVNAPDSCAEGDDGFCDFMITSVVVGVCLWYDCCFP